MTPDSLFPLPYNDILLETGDRLRFQGLWNPGGVEGLFMADGATWLSRKGLRVIASDEHTQHGRLRHVSLSYRHRDPNWREIKAVRAAFFPDTINVMLPLPRAEDYVAGVPGWEDSRVFHLWQCPGHWGIR